MIRVMSQATLSRQRMEAPRTYRSLLWRVILETTREKKRSTWNGKACPSLKLRKSKRPLQEGKAWPGQQIIDGRSSAEAIQVLREREGSLSSDKQWEAMDLYG